MRASRSMPAARSDSATSDTEPLATLVGLSMLLAPAGGIATLAVSLLVPRLRVRHARRHRQQAAMRERTRQAQRLAAEGPLLAPTRGPRQQAARGARTGEAQGWAAEWPLPAQTLGLGGRDQGTRQHRFPTAEFV